MYHDPSTRLRARIRRLAASVLTFGAAGAMCIMAATAAGSPPVRGQTGASVTGSSTVTLDATAANPTSNIAPCSKTWLVAINCARADEGVAAMPALKSLGSLSVAEQTYVLINLERVGRGLPPIEDLFTYLDGVAQTGADDATDPTLSGGVTWWGSIWYGGTNSAPQAIYDWMYNDGPGGNNFDCPSTGGSGCWGHRDNILHQAASCRTGDTASLFGGAADDATLSAAGGKGSIAEITIASCSPQSLSFGLTVSVSWAGALAAAEGTTASAPPPAPPSVTFSGTRIAGATGDATAAKELETEFPATGGTGTCVGGKANASNTRPVVVSTTSAYADALSASYLAASLDTGVLLTPPTGLPAATVTALDKEGVTRVIVVGGTMAVGSAVASRIASMTARSCGGASSLGHDITVTRIAGSTKYATAALIAETPATTTVGSASFTGAYGGVNAAGGDGKYNATSGAASAAPTSTARKTAIVATGASYQDAMAASATAYAMKFPVLLTPPSALSSQAAAAISDLGITQAIVVGGPVAVSNTVVRSLEALGVSVLRVAGTDATDTAAELAKFEVAATGLSWTGTTRVVVTRGNGFTDGLAGSVVTGKKRLPLLLTESPTSVGPYLTAFLKAAGAGVDSRTTSKVSALTVFGGPDALSTALASQMQGDL